MNATIRDAIPTDAAVIASIYASYVIETSISFEMIPPTSEEILTRMQRATDRLPWIVMEQESTVIGYAYATQFRAREAYRNTAETTVYVGRDQHRRGVGSQLMRSLLGRLRASGFHRVIAGVTLPNIASVKLHERLGYQPVGVFSEIGHKFGQWHDVGFWELRLSQDSDQSVA